MARIILRIVITLSRVKAIKCHGMCLSWIFGYLLTLTSFPAFAVLIELFINNVSTSASTSIRVQVNNMDLHCVSDWAITLALLWWSFIAPILGLSRINYWNLVPSVWELLCVHLKPLRGLYPRIVKVFETFRRVTIFVVRNFILLLFLACLINDVVKILIYVDPCELHIWGVAPLGHITHYKLGWLFPCTLLLVMLLDSCLSAF